MTITDTSETEKADRKRPYGRKAIPLEGRRAYDIDETAAALGVCRDTVYARIKDGTLKSLKLGRRRLVTNLDELLSGNMAT
jgi:excisionase family DNA binding protein